MTFIEEAIFSGFIGEVISKCVDVSWLKIKEAVKNKKNKHQNIESQIYNVIVNVLNQITYNKFRNDQDKIYQAAEKLIIDYKDDKYENLEAMRFCMQILGECINDNKYKEFKLLLYQELGKNDYEELYRQIRLLQQDEESNKTSRIEQKMDKVQQGVDETNRRLGAFLDNNRRIDNVQHKKLVKNRTQEYADKWNANMFLNDFDKRDENAGVNVKLREVYLDEHLPHYLWGSNKNISNDIKDLLSEYIEKSESNKPKSLLILGHPGIGKSTLITWIVANFSCRINDILVYQFASDLKDIDWNCTTKGYMYWDAILNVLGLTHDDLYGKVLIFDGFDEINVKINRIDILNKLMSKEIKELSADFSLIVTCRENYIHGINKIKYNYITLQPWNSEQIKGFCKIYSEKSKYNISKDTMVNILNNMEIFGIPLILYMVLALNISVEKEGSIVDVYDKVFTLDGGIYDRCINNRSFAEPHRIGEVKQQIHQISRKIAVWMFENNQVEAYIPQNEYQKICNSILEEKNQEKEDIQKDFLIGNYFKLVRHCEGLEAEELYFVHRSIYEYFVAETIYSSISNTTKKFSKENLDEFTGSVSVYLKKGKITYTICKYLQHKILKLCSAINQEELSFYQWMEMAVDKMVNNGMFYSSEYKDCNDIIYKEAQCFINLVEILRQLHKKDYSAYILMSVNRCQIEKYIKYCCITFEENRENYLNLSKSFLKNANLVGTNLSNINFANAMLEKVNLSRATLEKAIFNGAILKSANFESAILNRADLSNTDLSAADLSFANLTNANLINAVLKKSVLVETNLRNTNLTNANLENANLRGANLESANLNGTNLSNADLSRAILIDVNLKNAILYNVILAYAMIDKEQAGYLEGKCDLQDSWVLYNDELICYEEFKKKVF
ncbi:MAG: hypothetical protein HDR11_06700 [Lachnospiraceae bacterium]|nr:hypothetical protein [Lachnospiraceae bacterium]